MGAMKVALCFSAAIMKMANTSSAVKNISMKRPRTIEVPPPSAVSTAISPGKRAETTPADAMAPVICARTMTAPRIQGTAPIRHMPSVTYGRRVRRAHRGAWGDGAYGRVEQSTCDAEEDPGIYCEGEAECQRHKEEVRGVGRCRNGRARGGVVGDLCCREGEEEEHEGANELADEGHKVSAYPWWEEFEDRYAAMRVEFGIVRSALCFHAREANILRGGVDVHDGGIVSNDKPKEAEFGIGFDVLW
ncbi:hypothetical protein FH972_021784 [Carpinus fangiana]|uniref:Uncharacterized protein n=1 Tax=Carpinus fangiana TaxID=176857 RepID=A0A5N6KQP3_9ROSI|nr:hypothetical protein FH972_021784 [Carpinus fangiana]